MDFRCLRDNPNLTVIFDTDMCCDVDDLSVGFTTAEDGRHRYIILRRPYDEISKHISDAVKDAYTRLAK